MQLTNGLVCVLLFLSACGPVEINERNLRRVDSSDLEKTDSGPKEQPNTPGDTTKDPEDTKKEIPESKLPWDGLELRSTGQLLILEMEIPIAT